MKPVFVYQPRSQDRMIECLASVTGLPVIVTWYNESRHVIGGVHLCYSAAVSGRHWRDAARYMARRLVMAYGGAAWDVQGTIHLSVPAHAAADADQWMRAARAAALDESFDEGQRNTAALILAASAPLPRIWPPESRGVRATIARDGDRWRVTVADPDYIHGVVTAPDSWGPPTVFGADAVETIELGPAPAPAEADA
jgi:hypothetical protein